MKKRWWGLGVLVGIAAGATGLFVYTQTLADLRNAHVLREGDGAENRARGRALLEAAAEAHGLAAWQGYETLEITATDDWSGSFAGRQMTWWQTERQRLRHRMVVGTFTARVTLLDGPEEGLEIGAQAFRTFADGERTEDDDRAHFYPPTLNYFAELPFRLLSADVVTYAGQGRYGGRTFERVFVTWGSLEPREEVDQYDVWIDPQTHHLHSCRYTVREGMPAAAATIFFEDLRDVGGVMLAYRQTVVFEAHDDAPAPLGESFLHRYTIEDAAFDAVPRADVILDPALPSADAKPAISRD